jgi:hypothetical protein
MILVMKPISIAQPRRKIFLLSLDHYCAPLRLFDAFENIRCMNENTHAYIRNRYTTLSCCCTSGDRVSKKLIKKIAASTNY